MRFQDVRLSFEGPALTVHFQVGRNRLNRQGGQLTALEIALGADHLVDDVQRAGRMLIIRFKEAESLAARTMYATLICACKEVNFFKTPHRSRRRRASRVQGRKSRDKKQQTPEPIAA